MQRNKNQIHSNGTFNTSRKIIQLSELQVKMFKAARSNQQLRQPLKPLTKSSAGYCKKHCSHSSIRSSASNYPSHHKSQGIYLWNAKIPSQEVCIYQEMKILKILSLYHVWFRNYYHLRYGPFSLDTEPLKFLAF